MAGRNFINVSQPFVAIVIPIRFGMSIANLILRLKRFRRQGTFRDRA